MSCQPGDVIGETDCPCCGNRLPVKLNKNKTAYVMCMQIIVPEERERCGYKSSFGRKKSRELIKQFEADKENEIAEPEFTPIVEAPEPARIVDEPAGPVAGPAFIPDPAGKPKRRLFESRF